MRPRFLSSITIGKGDPDEVSRAVTIIIIILIVIIIIIIITIRVIIKNNDKNNNINNININNNYNIGLLNRAHQMALYLSKPSTTLRLT